MTPNEAVDRLNEAERLLRGTAKNLRSPSALADVASIATMLEGGGVGMQLIEVTQPLARPLKESLKARIDRVEELTTKIEGLRKLSDDVNTTPAEAGTAHRTANKLQTERDNYAELLIAARDAISGFADARDEFLGAWDLFSRRYENAKASELMRTTRARAAGEPSSEVAEWYANAIHNPHAPANPPRKRTEAKASPAVEEWYANAIREAPAAPGPARPPETKPNWIAVLLVAVLIGFIFAPALIPFAYFGPKWFRKVK